MKDRLKSLDTLKGIAIFAVVLFHLKDVFPGAFQDVLGIFYKWGGYFGNYLFFMLSGIYISWGYKKRIIDHELNFVEFMKRRLVKFYPAYFVTELICVYFIVKQTGMERLGIPEILRNLLCISCGWIDNSLPYNLPCWFLSQLLLIYILYFLYSGFSKKKRCACLED